MTQYLGFKLRRPELISMFVTYEELKALSADEPELHDDIRRFEVIQRDEQALAWDFARDAPHRLASIKDIHIYEKRILE